MTGVHCPTEQEGWPIVFCIVFFAAAVTVCNANLHACMTSDPVKNMLAYKRKKEPKKENNIM